MWRSHGISYIVGRLNQSKASRILISHAYYSKLVQSRVSSPTSEVQPTMLETENHHYNIGRNLSKRDKVQFLVTTLLDLNDSKNSIYGALDAWVAWEQNFPIGSLKRALNALEKEHQWHRIVQVIKWMLSKGQGTTMETYGQFILALDMDHRAEEAHEFWVKRIGMDLHSVPWQLCHVMMSVYYRNNMLEDLIRKVANAFEMLGLLEEKQRVLEKYNPLFIEKGQPRSLKEAGLQSGRKILH